MQKKPSDKELRQRAEAEVREKGRAMDLPEQDVRRLCHELEVHQVELELQNEALQELQRDLQASEEKYRDLYDFAPIGYVTLDAGGRILEANLAAASLLGEARAALMDQRFQYFLERESIRDFTAFRDRVLAADGKETVEVQLKASMGHPEAWVLVEGKAGDEQTFRIGLIDITERKWAEKVLQESEERYRQLFESMGEGFVLHEMVYDDEGRPVDYLVLDINPAYEKITGLRREQVIGKGITEIISVVETILFERYDEVVRLGRSMRFEDYNAGLDRWFSIHAFPVQGENQFAVIFTDITDRKREAMRISWLASFPERNPTPMVEIDTTGEVHYSNPAADRLFPDLKREGLHHPYLADVETILAELRQGAVASTLRNVRVGKAWYEQACHYLTDLQRLRIYGRDITGRKRAEEALMRRTDDLIRKSEELEAARDEANMYLDILTHDVRNANNVSSMYADLLVELLAGDQYSYARKLRESIQRSSEILKNVATFRRVQLESCRLVPVNLDALILEEIGNFPGASIRYEGRKVDVLADSLLPVIFTNLIGNAVKFGGADVEIAIRVEEQDGEVLASVEDTGPGVPDEVKELLFHRFERGRAHGRGEGLGLFIVRTLIERYGGTVRVKDRVSGHPGEGAAFKFTLRKA